MLFNILKSFRKRKKFCFFMIIQLFFCFISLNECFAMINYYDTNIKSVKKIISINNTFTINQKIGSNFRNIDKTKSTAINSFYQFLSDDTELSKKGGYLYNDYESSNNILGIDKNLLSYNAFNVIKGRNFTLEDFNDRENLPIILGYNFKDKFKLNENININNKNYKVVGFLKKDSIFLQEGNIFIDKLKNLDNYFLIPIFFDELDDINKVAFMQSYLFTIIKDNTEILQKINDKIKYFSLEYEVKPFKQTVTELYGQTKGFAKIKMINSLLLLLVSLSGIISNAILSIMNRKREFGILMALGASKKNIIIQVILENVLILIGAFILSFVHFSFLGRHLFGGILNVSISFYNIGTTTLILFILLLIISLIIIKSMFKFSLKDLIGGMH